MNYGSIDKADLGMRRVYLKMTDFFIQNDMIDMQDVLPALMLHVVANFLVRDESKEFFISYVDKKWDMVKQMLEDGDLKIRKLEGVNYDI